MNPVRAATVISQMPFWPKGTPAQRGRCADAVRQSHDAARANRDLVLAHPDLAARLLRCGYSRPERWNGWIPPNTTGEGDANRSPVVAELDAILAEAIARAGAR